MVYILQPTASAISQEPEKPAAAESKMSDTLFEMIAARVAEKPEIAKKVNAMFLFEIKDGQKVTQWSE